LKWNEKKVRRIREKVKKSFFCEGAVRKRRPPLQSLEERVCLLLTAKEISTVRGGEQKGPRERKRRNREVGEGEG